MQLKNVSGDGRDIPGVGQVEAGGTIEVDNDLGKSLAEQSAVWEKITPKKKTEGDE